jgi:hypothetical protein
MADTTKRRLLRAAKRLERQRRAALAARNPVRNPVGPDRGPAGPARDMGPEDLFPPGWPDDLDGGAGVREPRRPYPGMPAGALSLDPPESQYLDLVG